MLIGHLGDEVKIHYFEGGNCIARFPLATNETYTNKQTGEKVTNTDWHNIVLRNKAAEICEKYLSKGDKIYVEGRLKNRQWQGEMAIPDIPRKSMYRNLRSCPPERENLEVRPTIPSPTSSSHPGIWAKVGNPNRSMNRNKKMICRFNNYIKVITLGPRPCQFNI